MEQAISAPTMSETSVTINAIATKLVELNDAICYHERMAGMGYTVIVIPRDITQPVQVSLDGKPVDVDPERALEVAMMERGDVGADDDTWRAR